MEAALAARARARQLVAHAQGRRVVLGSFGASILLACLRVLSQWLARRAARAKKVCLSLSTPCDELSWKLATPHRYWECRTWLEWLRWGSTGPPECWRGACPCCKRPIEARLSRHWQQPRVAPEVKGKYAYVITLWGSSVDYVLGAMVLGHSIKRTGTRYPLICLHTDDVPVQFLRILSKMWKCRPMEHVSACYDKLSYQDDTAHRFNKVFTKLRVLELVEFEKVLLMDIDLIVTDNIEELFDLRAPAALRRGMNDCRWPLKTGDPIDGRAFFGAKDGGSKWSWGQGTGINAGVMLLRPDAQTFAHMLEEINEPSHPGHCRGNGPEQDYLSRYWADAPWTYLGVEYNYQLHQMFFSLHPKWATSCDRAELLKDHKRIKIIHLSGVESAKPWHRVLNDRWAGYWPDRSCDAEYVGMFADEFLGHLLWVRKDPETWANIHNKIDRTEMQDLFLGDDGEIWQKSWDGSGPPTPVDLPEDVIKGSMIFLSTALGLWFDCFEEVDREVEPGLREKLLRAADGIPKPPVAASSAISLADRFRGRYVQQEVQQDQSSRAGREHSRPSWKKDAGWWMEQSSPGPGRKLVVACGALDEQPFVSFCEGGKEVLGEREEVRGVYAKVAGDHSARHFGVPAPPSTGESCQHAGYLDELQQALSSIQIWSAGVPPGSAVMLAVVGLAMDALGPTLQALEPLGAPMEPPPNCRALAAIGRRPSPEDGGWGRFKKSDTWNCVASTDIAYTSMMLIG